MVTMKAALAAGATLIALAFALCTFERYLARRRRHELAWSISLIMFALASAALWDGVSTGWDAPTFRWFFLFGAIANVPWLALGTVYLLGGPRIGDRVAVGVAALTLFAAGVMCASPTRAAVPTSDLPQGKEVFGVLPRILAAISSGVGATVVIVGAVWSIVRLVRGQPHRPAVLTISSTNARRLVAGNVLIAVGTLILGASGTMAGRLGRQEAFAVTLVAGIAVLFAGFLVSTATSQARVANRDRAQAGVSAQHAA